MNQYRSAAQINSYRDLRHSGITVDQLNTQSQGTLVEFLGIQVTEIGADYMVGTMPAGPRSFQPSGRIHGGANVVLAETIGSMGAYLSIDQSKYICFGQEVNANHVRGVSSGLVTAIARPLYQGRSSQVWDIRIENDQGKLSCIARLTVAVVAIGAALAGERVKNNLQLS